MCIYKEGKMQKPQAVEDMYKKMSCGRTKLSRNS